MDQEIMTLAEIHDFGVEIVLNELLKEAYEILGVNASLEVDPQIVARKDGRLAFIAVRTDCYPNKGALSDGDAQWLGEHAQRNGATPYFASVGICNADARDEKEMATPVRGAKFNLFYSGLEILARPEQVMFWPEASGESALELRAARALAAMWNNLDAAGLEPLLADDVVYESQHVFYPMTGKHQVMEYLSGKLNTIRNSGLPVSAEIGDYHGRPVVVVYQGSDDPVSIVVMLSVGPECVERIDICGVAPTVDQVRRTGIFPVSADG